MNIFIGSLPYSVKDSDLQGFFEEYGEVSSARIITDKMTGRSKGFGFVEMSDEAAAKKAIEELNGAELEGRTIVVNEAQERTERKPGGGGRSFGGNSGGGQRRSSNGGGSNGGGSSYGKKDYNSRRDY
jgi:RNA recognition motif-containing protein